MGGWDSRARLKVLSHAFLDKEKEKEEKAEKEEEEEKEKEEKEYEIKVQELERRRREMDFLLEDIKKFRKKIITIFLFCVVNLQYIYITIKVNWLSKFH